MSDTRVVLVKPGDVLMLGNVTTPEDVEEGEAFDAALLQLKSTLGLAHVLVFEDDIDLAVKPAAEVRHEMVYRSMPVSRDLADSLARQDAFGRIGRLR
jgi:hypothetical protein